MAKEGRVSEGRRPEFTVTVFVDNLQSADTVKFSLVDVWVCLWVYLLMLHAQPCSTCEVFPALLHNWCFILYCVMQRPAHLKIQTFAEWLHAAHLWITCLFISVSHFTQFHAFCSILTPAVWIHVLALSSFFDSEVKQRLCSAHRAPPRFTHSERCLHVTPLIHCFVKVLAHQRCKYDRCSTSVTGRKKQGCLEKLHLWCRLKIQACLYGRHATEQC